MLKIHIMVIIFHYKDKICCPFLNIINDLAQEIISYGSFRKTLLNERLKGLLD